MSWTGEKKSGAKRPDIAGASFVPNSKVSLSSGRPSAPSAPRRMLELYESFLIQNASTIATVESSLRSVTWFLPGRFKDAELASEALAALLNILSLYHDTLLPRLPKSIAIFQPSDHTRYTRAWADSHAGYKWIARSLEVIKFVQLLIEMGLRRTVGPKGRWRGVVGIEFIKAILRITLLRITRRPVLAPPMPERELDPALLANADPQLKLVPPTQKRTPEQPTHLRNNHTAFSSEARKASLLQPEHQVSADADDPKKGESTLALADDLKKPSGLSPLLMSPADGSPARSIEDYLASKALSASSVRAPTALLRPLLGARDWISEILWILKPLLYVLALSRSTLKAGRTNPLLLSLGIETLSRSLRRSPSPSAFLERNEYARRDREVLWYLLRGDIWNGWTRPKLEGVANATRNKPLLSVLSALIGDWVPLIDEYYYYTSS